MKNHYLIVAGLCLGLCLTMGCQSPEPVPGRIEVLFLGHDNTHHHSAAYLPMLQEALAPKGFNFSYTEQLSDLNEDYLSNFDALMVYANHDSIAPDQERALLRFVKRGGGLLPIHCASYCFRNSEEYVKLVGAQFKSHGEGVFSPQVVQADHPITAGLAGFEAWDETYVHDKHTDDRTVLMERVEGEHREPWTWTKEYGKGRMFYTASGHDERVWSQPGFHQLLERGLLWAVGDLAKAELEMYQLPSLAYVAEDSIPNYEQRDPAPKLQQPLAPEASMQHIQLPPGYSLSLFASEPDLINPIAMNWDERGRLWVIETADYPNNINVEDGIGSDQIKICEDTDGDGKADKFTVFADQLSVPTSLVFSNGGVIVSQAPHFLFLKDTDGDDKADLRQKIISGWGTFDTHAGPSNLKYGFDNHIWGVLGYSGFEGTVGETQHKFSQGVYRFKPDGSWLELV
ncbi:MAG: PVC-type heme-binding CxxCH protein, partial [Bacteroidota bacterium]